MKLERIDSSTLNGRQKEIYNFQKSAAILADFGFNCIWLTDDRQGADFLAYHKDGAQTLKVQLRGRVTIRKVYIGKDLWMNFPIRETWYLVPHDELVSIAGETTPWLTSMSWRERGGYSSGNPSERTQRRLSPYAIG